MLRTRVGYAGGETRNPTYHDLGDHTESFQVDYEPARLSFDGLLEVFWAVHDPAERSWSRQYANILFVQDDGQERLARESLARVEARLGTTVRTEIRRLDRFWPAEDYHQKYSLRGEARLMAAFRRLCPDETAFRESPAAAKVNAWLAGDLSYGGLREQLASLGLEAVGEGRLEDLRPLADAAVAR